MKDMAGSKYFPGAVLLMLFFLTAAAFSLSGCKRETVVRESEITPDQTLSDIFTRHTVTGITTALPQAPDVPGFIGVSYLTIGDINKDGTKEIIATSGLGHVSTDLGSPDGEVAIFTWDGQDINSWKQSVISDNFVFPNETVLRDFDDDGNTDIMVLDNFLFCLNAGGIYYLRNKGMDNITSASNWEKITIYQGGNDPIGQSAYHRAVFLDLDGDGLEDFITSKISYCLYTDNTGEPYAWIEWFKNEGDGTFSGPYEIGNGAGFMFYVDDVNHDGRPDVLAPQFFITDPVTKQVKGSSQSPSDEGASLLWFENPRTVSTSEPWKSHIIDYWHTSKNPMGKAMEVITADIDLDGDRELLVSTHNHQNYVDPATGLRFWPGGVFALEIPRNPARTSSWEPVTLDAGDPDLDPADAAAVAADPFGVDRAPDPNAQGSPGMVRAANVSGDSLVDMVLPGDGKGALYYYEAQGLEGSKLLYKRTVLYADPRCVPGDAQIADIDGDGKLDIIACFFDTSVNKNTKSGSIFIFKQK